MTKKVKVELNMVMADIEDILFLQSFKALTVALQKEVAQLRALNAQLIANQDECDKVIKELRDQVSAVDTDASAYQRGFVDGQSSRDGEYDEGHREGFNAGYTSGFIEGEIEGQS